MKTTEFDDLIFEIRTFAQERNWEQFHNPKNLAMAITGEAGELAAEFQWLTSELSEKGMLDPEKLRDISLEIADVQIYLLRLADVLGIDIPSVVRKKIAINGTRFPK